MMVVEKTSGDGFAKRDIQEREVHSPNQHYTNDSALQHLDLCMLPRNMSEDWLHAPADSIYGPMRWLRVCSSIRG